MKYIICSNFDWYFSSGYLSLKGHCWDLGHFSHIVFSSIEYVNLNLLNISISGPFNWLEGQGIFSIVLTSFSGSLIRSLAFRVLAYFWVMAFAISAIVVLLLVLSPNYDVSLDKDFWNKYFITIIININ